MIMTMRAIFSIQIALSPLAYAHWLGQMPAGPLNNYGLPAVTATSSRDDTTGWSPNPTEAPLVNDGSDVSFIELMRRSEYWMKAKRETTQYLNSKTCGYFPTEDFDPFVCPNSETCSTNTNNVVACMSRGVTGPFFSVCFDYSAYLGGLCDNEDTGAETGCCKWSTHPACVMYLWPGPEPKSMYFCNPSSTIVTMLDVPKGVLDASTSSTSSDSPLTTTTSATQPPTQTPEPAPINTGAIAGGVVGGVAGLALIAGALAFFLLRRRKTKSNPNPTTPSTNPAYTAVPPNDNPNQQPYPSPPLPQNPPDFLSPPGSSTLRSETPYLTHTTHPNDAHISYQYDPSKPPEMQQGYFHYGPGGGGGGIGLYPHGTPDTLNTQFGQQQQQQGYTPPPPQGVNNQGVPNGQEQYHRPSPPLQQPSQLSELDTDNVVRGQSGNPAEMSGEGEAMRQSGNPVESPVDVEVKR
ncbi:hypothetical protein QBC41DRAFT_360570 [Cercophora samala]|uniref:Uncharacterized protein n=1 Tax=Cercophora samala TaxID=330535 RepID=A0AA40D0I6_9PEZI|nr:hypothetical protein QBC41DRAFT_360570 [Cercophora samala]